MSGKWTPRDWLPSWAVAALAVAELSLRGPLWVPSLASLAALAIIPLRPRPWPLPRWSVYALALPFLAAFALQLSSPRTARVGWEDLGIVPGWYFACLSVLQAGSVGRSTRPAHAGWTAFAAQVLSGPAHSPWSFGATILQTALLVLLLGRGSDTSREIRRPDRRIVPALGVVVALSLLFWSGGPLVLGLISPHGRWMASPRSLKGFSPVMLLGSFADEWDGRDQEVVARACSAHAPTFLTGMVRDVYGAGSWRTQGRGRPLASPRNLGDATVFCRDGRDPGSVPSGWIRLAVPTEGYLPLPPRTACEAVVGDTAMGFPTGSVLSADADRGRGIWWYADTGTDTSTTPSDLAVPRSLGGLLDSTLTECAPDSGDHGSRNLSKAISSWFARSFRYTLAPGWARGEDPVRRFLRERRGYCEYFATAAVLLLRRAGVPARYATGYAYPDGDARGTWTFRRSNAHAWVLVLDPRRGWMPFDPTPPSDRPTFRRAGIWTRWIQNLDGRLQILWHGFRDGNWRSRLDDRIGNGEVGGRWGIWGGGIAIAALVLFLVRGRRDPEAATDPSNDWRRRLESAEARLRRAGHLREPGETVGKFLLRLPPGAPGRPVSSLRQYQERRFAP
ncbi:MAG TPA: transglutaminase-like domain-containing protein [Fibrobacteria bacterium]|nr:transglutaminase-like domain-containing protein [Fibrobacteria bacterium]